MSKEPVSPDKRILDALLRDAPAIEKSFHDFMKEFETLRAKDHSFIGRFLVCHLLIEFYLTRYLESAYPTMPRLSEARLSFAQKLELAVSPTVPLALWHDGIRCLNRLRNRIAHNVTFEPSEQDLQPISQIVNIWHNAAGKPPVAGIEMVEALTGYVCMQLSASVDSMSRHAESEGIVGLLRWWRRQSECGQ